MKSLSILVFSLLVFSLQAQDSKFIGEAFEDSTPITLNEAINDHIDKTVAVKAKVNAVCQVKGCWMTLSSTELEDEIFVKFKDYGFFMPLDLAGSEVVAHGVISKTSTSVEELRHYAEDAGKTKEEIMAITEPKEEYKMMADGVVIMN